MDPNESGTCRIWIEFDPFHSNPSRMQAGSDMGSIEPGLDPIWIRLSLARLGKGLKLFQPIPIQVGRKRFGVRHGFD